MQNDFLVSIDSDRIESGALLHRLAIYKRPSFILSSGRLFRRSIRNETGNSKSVLANRVSTLSDELDNFVFPRAIFSILLITQLLGNMTDVHL